MACSRGLAVPLLSIGTAFLLGAVMILISGRSPLIAYQALFQGIFGSLYNIGESLSYTIPYILTGLSVAFAFRTGLFNIGVEGQYLWGQLAAVYVGFRFSLPGILHPLAAMLAAGLVGALWAWLPGYLKARKGIHEVISTIMMNYIALISVNFLIRNYLKVPGEKTPDILPSASLQSSALTALFGGSEHIHYGLLAGLLAAFLFYLILWKTRRGFELRAVGLNPHASEYAGMSVPRNIVASMLISGILAGMGGATMGLGYFQNMTIGGFQGYGFNGIAVALIGGNTAVGVLLAAFLFGGLQFGSGNMQFEADVAPEIIQAVIAFIVLLIASKGVFDFLMRKTETKGSGR